ncbi:MAG TPA: hypothetical protein VOA80_12600 [Thermoanaerobaculia bacterium]|nr:hypothetical protein [Thermoanaerobaculia bacterium]
MIGLRFLEWSVWAMPLTGFEFARQSKGRYQATIKGRIEEALPGVWEGQQVPEPDVLYADAFATCMTGPAYLLAAIHLRLSIEETARAVVIFRVLRGLDKDETLGKDFLDGFRTGWQSSPASGDSLPAEEVEKLERFADAALAALRIFHMGAVYSVDQDWSNAKSISNGWRDAAETPEGELGLPDHLRVITPADVLNAAWYCRIKQFVDIPRLERAVRNYFERPAPAGPSSRMQQPPIG